MLVISESELWLTTCRRTFVYMEEHWLFYDGIFRVLLEQTGGHIYTIAANSSDHFLTHFHLQFSYDTVHI